MKVMSNYSEKVENQISEKLKPSHFPLKKNNFQLSTFNFQLIILFLFATFQLQAQTDHEKALQEMEEQVASGELSDEEMFEACNTLLWYYFTHDFEKARHYAQKGISFAIEKKNKEREVQFLTSMGDVYSVFGKHDSVFYFLDKALKIIEENEYYSEEFWNYEARGNFYRQNTSDYEKSLNAFLKCLEAAEKDKAKSIANNESIERSIVAEIRALGNISNIYGETFNLDKSIEYLLRAKKIMDDNPSINFSKKHVLLGNLAEKYIYINEIENALPLLEEAYKLAVALEDYPIMVSTLYNYTSYYSKIGNFTQALTYGKQALQVAEKSNHIHLIRSVEEALARLYLNIKDYKSSLYYIQRALEKTTEDDWYILQGLYLSSIMAYSAMGNIEKANEYGVKYQDMIRKISDANMHNALQEMEVKYDVQQKELEIVAQQAKIKQQRTRQFTYIGVIIAAGLMLAMLFLIIRQRNRRNRELAETNATKDKFFSIISHDLKGAVVTQRNALQLLIDNINKWDANTLSDYCGQMSKLSDNLFDLLKNLLNWSMMQSGRKIYNPTMFNLIAVLQPDITLVKKMTECKNITFETQLPQTAIITADENMLTTVIRNLLTNAVKFTASDGMVKLEILPRGTGYTIVVTDTGIGMSQEHIRDLFRLEHAHSQHGTDGEKGTGLGILVCKEMLEKHGSKLHVESEIGEGSRFWFEI